MWILFKRILKKRLIKHLNNRIKSGSLRLLFICGHMRSGSSLLVHILNTNPEILGYGETHIKYLTPSDYGKVAYNIFRLFNTYKIRKKYIMDKVLHTRLLEHPNLLNHAKTIFIIREPRQSLKSILELNLESTDTPKKTYLYYKKRLKWIDMASAQLNSDKWTFITYEELTKNPELSFNKIENLLGLQKPLTSNYNTMWSTGKKGIGDSSGNIKAGKIIHREKSYFDTEFIPYYEQSQQIFDECLENLKHRNVYPKI